jgi:hypothetical protein
MDIDAALVAFYGDDPQDWRFSFVKMEYQLEEVDGTVKPVEKLTHAKRCSFLVGTNEPNHTCKRQLLKLIMEEKVNPSIEEIEEAFSIDNVTKEFFLEYKDLFLALKDSLEEVIEKDSHVKKEVEDKSISTVDFAKKLLGQIVFIYFLQKKGWLGVEKDRASGGFRPWGSGPKDFLMKMFDKEIVQYDNFFNDILEPLFYEALATKRDDDYYSRFNCKIPFLNGGLFEPINDYDWTGTEILLNNSIFGNILGTFDRFNFTVKEDEPLEKEVAIDPEMLGKVFENLLDVKDRKSRGAFYTPREIVHYMCQQSLINYLETNTEIPIGDIEKFIRWGDFAIDLMIREQEQIKKYGRSYGINEKDGLPKSITENYLKIDRLLKDIKIVDPAVGSGAFPIGMMNEIVKARSALTTSFNESKQKNRTNYNFKRETIENSLYGVDIDSSAVDIAKLRFWLSMIVDEPNMADIQPLPNLDHKIMCGNSLLEEFEGVKLFDEELLGEIPRDNSFELEQVDREEQKLNQELNEIYTGKKENKGRSKEIKRELGKLKRKRKKIIAGPKEDVPQSTLDEVGQKRRRESQIKLKELRRLQKRLINEPDKESKRQHRSKIEQIVWELIEETLKEEGNEEAMDRLEQYKKNKSKPFFLWKLYFLDVFQRENPGFDVVIANPPYVGEDGHKEIFRPIAQGNLSKFYQGKMDIFYFFLHVALNISRQYSQITFITTNYYPTAFGAEKLRKDFEQRAIIRRLINFSELKIFESAKGQHNMITILSKDRDKGFIAKTCETKRKGIADSKLLNSILNWSDEETEYFEVKQPELYEGKNSYIRLMGTGVNSDTPVHKILNKIKSNSNNQLSHYCNINQGVVSGCDTLSNKLIDKLTDKNSVKLKEGIFVFSLNNERDMSIIKTLSQYEKKHLKSFFKNSEIGRYWCNTEPNKLLLYLDKDIHDLEDLPNIKNHLLRFKEILLDRREVKIGRIKFFCLQWPRIKDIFSKEKIVVPYRSKINSFAYNNVEWFCRSDSYVITIKNPTVYLKYILSLLNSKLFFLWLYYKGKRKGEILELFQTPLSEIPIKEISRSQQTPFIKIVDQIHSITKDDDYLDNLEKQARVKELEKEIDKLVYKLYDLTPEEIAIVENFNKEK